MSARRRARSVVVVGGGPNGLAAAALLARAGRSVTLLERREQLGGLAAGEEFHPGFHSSGILHESANLRPELARRLELERHGLAFAPREPARLALERGGPGLLLDEADDEACARAIGARCAPDAEAYRSWRGFQRRVGPFVARFADDPPPELEPRGATDLLELARTGVALRRLGAADVIELLRVAPMCVADWVKDAFETPLLRAALAAPALTGTWLGPWSAGSAANLLLARSTRARSVRGGPAALVRALEAAARSAGVTVRLGARAARIAVERDGVRGVELEGGEALQCEAVLATVDPYTALMELVPRRALPDELDQTMRAWRARGTTAKLHLALDGAPPGLEREGALLERATSGESLDELERAFDAVKYGELSERPWLDLCLPSASSPELAPQGKHVLSVLVHFAPYALAGGWDGAAHAELERRALDVLEELLPGTRTRVLACETLAPTDLEARYGTRGGHVHHGEHALDQLASLRPCRACGRYATPIPGLFLGGSGSHPGGGQPGAAGALAAAALLEA